jgi:hypothetical protein
MSDFMIVPSEPQGSSGQIQYNNSGTFGGMAGTSWDATNQQLTIAGKTFTSGAPGPGATLTLNKTYNQSVLDLKPSDPSGKILRVFPDGGWGLAPGSPRIYIDAGGGFYSQAWMIISGSYTGSGDSLAINPPSLDPGMLALWADVQTAWQSRVWNAASGRHWTALDRNGNYVLSVEEYGNIGWAGSASTYVMDTSLSRIGAAGLAVGNGTAGDFTGSLKLTTLKFPDGTNQTTAYTGSGVTGLTIASGKSLTVNNILTLAGTDSTTMTFPSSSATIPGIGLAQTWAGTQTFGTSIVFSNNTGIGGTLAAGGVVPIFLMDSINSLNIGYSTIGHVVVSPGTGKQIRFLNAATTAYIMTLNEANRDIGFGSNTFDSIWTFYDSTATTGDSVLSIRDGAARASRVRWGSNAGTYDVGLARDSAGVLAVVDGSTTLSNYRDLKARSVVTTPLTYATLPASPVEGQRCYITDGNTTTFYATVSSGGGSSHIPVLYNGTNWVVA